MNSKILIALFVMAGMTACDDGPAENLGESIDNAAYEAEQAARDAADRLDDAATDTANAIEDACEDATDQDC
jgi:hypothetical protein